MRQVCSVLTTVNPRLNVRMTPANNLRASSSSFSAHAGPRLRTPRRAELSDDSQRIVNGGPNGSTKVSISLIVISALAALAWARPARQPPQKDILDKGKKAQAQRQAASQRAAALGMKPGVAGVTAFQAATPLPGTEGPGGIPHYFGPYANWAYSPMPTRSISAVTVDNGGAGYPIPSSRSPMSTAPAPRSRHATVVGGVITAITVAPAKHGVSTSRSSTSWTTRSPAEGHAARPAARAPSPPRCSTTPPPPAGSSSSWTACRSSDRRARTTSASTSRSRPRNRQARRPIQLPTTTRSASSSSTRRCTPACRRPSSGATCNWRRPRFLASVPLTYLDGEPHQLSRDDDPGRGRRGPPLPRAHHRGNEQQGRPHQVLQPASGWPPGRHGQAPG